MTEKVYLYLFLSKEKLTIVVVEGKKCTDAI